MNRKELIDDIENGTTVIRNFLDERDFSSYPAGSCENWNDGDTVGHIVGWMNYSIDKLTCIRHGTTQSDEYAQVSSLDDINTILYNKTKGKNKEEIETDYIHSLGNYLKVVSLFSNNDINLTTFETGFATELWRYMIMDTVIHPIQHILYQYLKKNEYGKIVDILATSEGIFDKYSEGKNAYALSELGIDKPELQHKLHTMEIEYKGNKQAQEFVRINRTEIA
jgi:hypothetical protein